MSKKENEPIDLSKFGIKVIPDNELTEVGRQRRALFTLTLSKAQEIHTRLCAEVGVKTIRELEALGKMPSPIEIAKMVEAEIDMTQFPLVNNSKD